MKQFFGIRCSKVAHEVCCDKVDRLDMSMSSFVEAVCMREYLKKGRNLSEVQLDELWDCLAPGRYMRLTDEFRRSHKELPHRLKEALLWLLYEISIMENIEVDTKKNANFYIWVNNRREYLFYYVAGKIKGRPVEEYVSSTGVHVETLGMNDGRTDEYVYLGKMQQFKNSARKSDLFQLLCKFMNVPGCDCIRVHYSQIQRLIEAINRLCWSVTPVMELKKKLN